ncbi:MAG: hypothetical protein JKY03_12695 [Aureispira sp.]|nr:hypothetical protein [Aureispira sp.]
MKLLYLLHALFYAYLIHLGFYYMELDEALWVEFARVGWEHYEGADVDSPENSYYTIWLVASLFTAFVAWTVKTSAEDSVIARWSFFVASISVIAYGVLLFEDGDVSMKESQMSWIFIGSFQVLMGLGGVFSSFLTKVGKIGLKQLFFFNGVLYALALGLGFYFLSLDNNILAEKARLGELYEGLSRHFPENTYHFILAILTVGSLFLGRRIKGKALIYPIHQWLLLLFFLYNVIVLLNRGSLDMRETQYWWVSLTLITSVFSFLIFRTLENKLPEREENFYKDNILDDLSSLE